MSKASRVKTESGHMHAWSLYEPISWRHYYCLLVSIALCRIKMAKSVTAHLPLELQHKKYLSTISGMRFVKFGEFMAALFKVPLYWENAPLLNYGIWDLKDGQTEWELVPRNIKLCFDTGHAMLGQKSPEQARENILAIIKDRGEQIRHLHIHENDLVHDSHLQPGKVLIPELIEKLTKNRSYIFELP